MKVSLVQMNSINDKAANIAAARALIERAVAEEAPDWVLLPEQFDWAGGVKGDKATQRGDAARRPGLCDGAGTRRQASHLHPRRLVHGARSRATSASTTPSVVFNREGEEIARYRKIHLFDVTTPGRRRL